MLPQAKDKWKTDNAHHTQGMTATCDVLKT